jgi:hypothetical protein
MYRFVATDRNRNTKQQNEANNRHIKKISDIPNISNKSHKMTMVEFFKEQSYNTQSEILSMITRFRNKNLNQIIKNAFSGYLIKKSDTTLYSKIEIKNIKEREVDQLLRDLKLEYDKPNQAPAIMIRISNITKQIDIFDLFIDQSKEIQFKILTMLQKYHNEIFNQDFKIKIENIDKKDLINIVKKLKEYYQQQRNENEQESNIQLKILSNIKKPTDLFNFFSKQSLKIQLKILQSIAKHRNEIFNQHLNDMFKDYLIIDYGNNIYYKIKINPINEKDVDNLLKKLQAHIKQTTIWTIWEFFTSQSDKKQSEILQMMKTYPNSNLRQVIKSSFVNALKDYEMNTIEEKDFNDLFIKLQKYHTTLDTDDKITQRQDVHYSMTITTNPNRSFKFTIQDFFFSAPQEIQLKILQTLKTYRDENLNQEIKNLTKDFFTEKNLNLFIDGDDEIDHIETRDTDDILQQLQEAYDNNKHNPEELIASEYIFEDDWEYLSANELKKKKRHNVNNDNNADDSSSFIIKSTRKGRLNRLVEHLINIKGRYKLYSLIFIQQIMIYCIMYIPLMLFENQKVKLQYRSITNSTKDIKTTQSTQTT